MADRHLDFGQVTDHHKVEWTGYLVPPFEAAGFTSAVLDLVASPEKRAMFGAAGRHAIEGRSWPAVGDELIGHYRAVCEKPVLAAAA